MTISQTPPSPAVEVIAAPPELEPVLANLWELYAHDFSEFIELRLGADGRFGCERLHSYWSEPGRHPFVVTVNGHLAGFVFVRKGSAVSDDPDIWDMADFFVVRGFRRLGIGVRVARDIWARFPGRWEVRVIDRNRKALAFWRRAVDEFLGGAVEPARLSKDGRDWHVFSFESGRARASGGGEDRADDPNTDEGLRGN